MNRNDYWRKREEEQLKHYLTEEADIQRAMAEKYNYMLYQIQAQINDFYARYARREQITLAEAMQRVSKMDVQAFAAKAKKYVEKRDFSPKANRELRLYNATMRINRLELLKANIGLEMVDGFNDLEHLMDNSLTKRTTDELKRQEEILRRDAGILGETISNNAKTVGSIVNASFNNATWSERIWGNQTQLRNELSSLLTQGLIQGRNPRVLAPALEKMFGVSKRNAERLMATELARVQTDAQMQTFKENEIDEYIFLSMDTACHECMALNEEHFPVKDAMPGENAPPIHPNCRCSTAAYVDREAVERELFDRNSDESVSRYMSNDEREAALKDKPAGRVLTREEKGQILEYAQIRRINIHGINKFDGDITVLKAVMDEIESFRGAFPRVFKGKRITLKFSNLAENDYAVTDKKTITLNNLFMRDRAFTERDMRNSGRFTNPTIEGMIRHEFGHIVEFVHGEKGLQFAKQAYYNIHGREASSEVLKQYIRKEISYYAYPEVINRITDEVCSSPHEITSEVLSSKDNTEFIKLIREMWLKEGLR